ncbi:MAG: tyrosine-type recombinase/integrase, partial [Bryobacteraceae bacterium]|nr:tyrosine-type recombinase/integrase [Bryobacteraceae bacterium]
AGHRTIPMNNEAMAAFARLRRRAEQFGGGAAEHFVFPACENGVLDFTRNQRTFRTAWRSLVGEAARQAGRAAARVVLDTGGRISAAKAAWRRAEQALRGFRFHDLRHQSITEMAEGGVPDATLESIAGHLSKKMLDHYSHVRMDAKRQAVQALGGGLISAELNAEHADGKAN